MKLFHKKRKRQRSKQVKKKTANRVRSVPFDCLRMFNEKRDTSNNVLHSYE